MSLISGGSIHALHPFSLVSSLENRMSVGLQVSFSFLSDKDLIAVEATSKGMKALTALNWKKLSGSTANMLKWVASQSTTQRDKWNYCLSKFLLSRVNLLVTKQLLRPLIIQEKNNDPFYGLLNGLPLKNRSFEDRIAEIEAATVSDNSANEDCSGELLLSGLLAMRNFAMEPTDEGLNAIANLMIPALRQGAGCASMIVVEHLPVGEPFEQEKRALKGFFALESAEQGNFQPLEMVIDQMDLSVILSHSDREYPPLLNYLVNHFMNQGDYQQAAIHIGRLFKISGDATPTAILENGVIASADQRSWSEAVAYFENIPPTVQTSKKVIFHAAQAYLRQGQLAKAEEMLEKLYKENDEINPVALIEMLAKVKRLLMKLDEAQLLLSKAIYLPNGIPVPNRIFDALQEIQLAIKLAKIPAK